MNPNDFTGSPAYITWNGITFQLLDDNWTADSEIIVSPQRTNIQGHVGDREEYVLSTFKAQPIAFKSTLAAVVPAIHTCYTPQMRGQRIRSNTDLPLVVQTADGVSLTYTSAVLTKPAALQCAPNKPLFGPVEFVALRKKATTGSGVDNHVVVASSAYTEPVFDPTDVLSTSWTYAYGSSSPFNAIECDETGVKIEPNVQLTNLMVASQGLLNYQIGDVDVQARFMPQNLTAANFADVLVQTDGTNAGRGTWLGARGLAFTVTGGTTGDPIVTIPLSAATKGQQLFGAKPRVGEVILLAQRKLSTTLQPLWTVTFVP